MAVATSGPATRRFKTSKELTESGSLARFTSRVAALSLLATVIAGPATGYNSEEHKVLTDMGVAGVVVPAGIEFPGDTRFDFTAYLSIPVWPYFYAKELAVGFRTNDPADYDEDKKKVQDNSYWYGYGQLKYNKEIWIQGGNSPLLRRRGLWVEGNVGNADDMHDFTFGELVALYGDYRRTTSCDRAPLDPGICSLTNRDTLEISFLAGQDCFGIGPLQECGFRPDPVPMADYLSYIGSGLVPPFGSAGNATANTAGDEEIWEAGWWGDEMLRIANVNDWHFSNGAVAWYVGMHRLAVKWASAARFDPRYWNRALHYEANALHSLTDLFAFGHVVTSRAETSRGIMATPQNDLLDERAYRWMQRVTGYGGGENDGDGRVNLAWFLPDLGGTSNTPRNDFLPSYRRTVNLNLRANRERNHHDAFNTGGAMVRNLAGNRFRIFGDGDLKLRAHQPADRETMAIIAEAVRVSVQSLLNAHVDMDCGAKTYEEIAAPGSSYFDALKLIPVFVENDHQDYFNGRWTSYAEFINILTDSAVVPAHWKACEMQYVDGSLASLPWSSVEACTTFPEYLPIQVPADDFTPACSEPSNWNLTESARDASDWLNRNPAAEVTAFDEFSPGIANGGGCLEDQSLELQLDGGTMTITPTGPCAISDASGTPAVSDLPLETFQYMTLDFDPPIEAFYANFGSVREGERVRLWLNPDDRTHQVLETAPSPDNIFAFGHGFSSDRPVSRIIVQGTGLDVSVLGAFVGLVPREPSLGQVGPSGEYEADFAVVFSSAPSGLLFEDDLESGDTSAWSMASN